MFAATATWTVPSPVPAAPEDTVIHAALLVAVHLHPLAAVTAMVTGPPAAGTFCCAGAAVNEQDSDWLIVNVCPAIVIVPDRGAPVWAAAVNDTVPLPVPLFPPVTVIQSALLAAVHAQDAEVVTATVPEPPAPGTSALVGDSEYAQPPACVTVKVWPAAVIVAVRAAPVLATAAKRTVPLPVPLAPEEIDSQSTSSVADHAHALSVRTSNDPWPPAASTDPLAADNVNVQPCPWFTVKACPAIVAVPDRLGPLVAATVSCTVPFPVPCPFAMVIHGALLAAVQLQSAPVATLTATPPPASSTDASFAESAYVHPCAWVTTNGCPAIVSVADRVGPLLGLTTSETAPVPLVLVPPAVIVIQSTGLVAVHVHPAVVVTATLPVPPSGPVWYAAGMSEYEHPCDCVIAKRRPATVITPVRGGPAVAATS